MNKSDAASSKWTEKQGQYLAFIHNYSLMHGRPPAEQDMQNFFGTTPPTIHQMILKLEEKGGIERTPRTSTLNTCAHPSGEPAHASAKDRLLTGGWFSKARRVLTFSNGGCG